MSTLSQFTGGERISSLVGTPVASSSLQNVYPYAGATAALSGAMTAATLKTALSVTGRGRLNWAALYANDATPRTLRMKITVNGAVIRDYTSASISTANTGFVGVGGGYYNGTTAANVFYQPIRFSESLLIEIASSRAESGVGNDQLTFAYAYEVFV
jgi:hypothetical protein